MAKIKKSNKPVCQIPTSSMSDIAFLLLVFFMVSTVFVKERGLKYITMPKASKEILERGKIPRKHAATIYVDKNNLISIDDYPIQYAELYKVATIMGNKRMADPNLITCFRADENTEYRTMHDIMQQLRQVEALRVSFEAKLRR